MDITRNVRGIWALEDLIVILLPPLTLILARFEAARGLVAAMGGSMFGRITLFLMMEAGLWAVFASRLPAGETHPEGGDLWGRMHLGAAYAALIFGIPLLFLLLTHGTWGPIYLYAAAHVVGCAAALYARRRPEVLEIPFERRRWLLMPTFFLGTYATIRLLTARFLFEDTQLIRFVNDLRAFDAANLAVDALEVVFLGLLFVVPYAILVIFPRFVGGAVEGPWTWFRRYAAFCASLCLCLVFLLIAYGRG